MRKSTGVVAARFLVRAGLLVLLPALSRAALAESGYYHHSRSGGRKTTEEVCTADDALDGSQARKIFLEPLLERQATTLLDVFYRLRVLHSVSKEFYRMEKSTNRTRNRLPPTLFVRVLFCFTR